MGCGVGAGGGEDDGSDSDDEEMPEDIAALPPHEQQATVVRLQSIRMVLALAAQHDWIIWQFDIKQAFLQADLQGPPLYMRMPPNLPDRDADGNLLVCKLKKSLYGLRQAAREWATLLQ